MIFQTYEDFLPQLNTLLSKIQKDFASEINDSKQTTKKYKNKLYEYIDKGKIKYTGTYFIGTFTREMINDFKKKGAKFNKIGVYLPYEKLDLELKQFIRKQKADTKNHLKQVEKKIKNYNISIFDNYIIGTIAMVIFKKLLLSTTKEGFKNNNISLSNIQNLISNGFNKNVNDIKDYLLSQINNINNNQSLNVINNLVLNKFNHCIKNEIYNTTNKVCFYSLKETCENNNVNYFYWWHRPTKRPSDRLEHRKHYQESLRGKKFYFNNLPKYNGEDDYPGKLWNCHCRIYVNIKDFKEARE